MQYRPGGLDELAVADIKAQEDERVIAKLEELVDARERAGLLLKRQALDERAVQEAKLAALYGGGRKGRRRARAEVERTARKKRKRDKQA